MERALTQHVMSCKHALVGAAALQKQYAMGQEVTQLAQLINHHSLSMLTFVHAVLGFCGCDFDSHH